MNIAPANLKDHVSPETPVALRNEHGALLRFLDAAEVCALADDRAVYGVAKGGKLSHVMMNGVNEQEVTNILTRSRTVSRVASEASKTIRRVADTTKSGVPFTHFEHIRNKWFGPKERYDYRNGERVQVFPVVPEPEGLPDGRMVLLSSEMGEIAAGVFREGYESPLPAKESAFA